MDSSALTRTSLHRRLQDRQPEMLELLARWVNQDSGSYDAADVDAMGARLAAAWRALGFEEEVRPVPERGALRLLGRRLGGRGRLLILGHLDTVWPAGTAAAWPFSRDETHAYGPGVGDMKGGQVMALFAVGALLEAGFDGLGEIAVLAVPDEELGSPGSRAEIEREAGRSDWTLVLEPARPDGSVVVGRGAVGAMIVEASGRTAHAAVNPEEGRNAILPLAHLAGLLEALSDLQAGTILTPGILRGGTARQVVPERAELHLDLRARDEAAAKGLVEAIQARLAQTQRRYPDAALAVTGGVTRPAFPEERGRVLYALHAEESAALGVAAPAVTTRGGSDGSFAAALGCPTLDGLGPVCFDTCSRRERILLTSLPERAALFARLILRIAEERP